MPPLRTTSYRCHHCREVCRNYDHKTDHEFACERNPNRGWECPFKCGFECTARASMKDHKKKGCYKNVTSKSPALVKKLGELYTKLLESLPYDTNDIVLWLGKTSNPLLEGLTYPQWFSLHIVGFVDEETSDNIEQQGIELEEQNHTVAPNIEDDTQAEFEGKNYRLENEAIMARLGISECPHDKKPTVCKGIGWTHGKIACKTHTILSVDNCEAPQKNPNRNDRVCWIEIFRDCRVLYDKIQAWKRKGRVNDLGVPICSYNTGCEEAAFLPYTQCKEHYEKVKKKQKHSDRSRVNNTTRRSYGKPGSDIQTAYHAAEFLRDCERIQAGHLWKKVKNGGRLRAIDLEFVRLPGRTFLPEVGIVDERGKTIFEAKVHQHKTVGELYQIIEGSGMDSTKTNIARNQIQKFYRLSWLDPRAGKTMASGVDMADVVQGFGNVVKPGDICAEWNLSWCDYYMLYENFEHVGMQYLIPDRSMWLQPLMTWRKLVPGFYCWNLGTAFKVFCPDEEFRGEHEAAVDAWMLYHMVFALLKYIK